MYGKISILRQQVLELYADFSISHTERDTSQCDFFEIYVNDISFVTVNRRLLKPPV